MSRGRGGRRGAAGARDAVAAALAAWRDHSAHCHQCSANAGHPAAYCGTGFILAQDVTRTRETARAAAQLRQQGQGSLW